MSTHGSSPADTRYRVAELMSYVERAPPPSRVLIDDFVVRIRRLPAAKRKKLEEIVRSLEESPPAMGPVTAEQPATSGALQPVHGLLRDLGPAPSDEAIDEARRELWTGFPREDLP